MGQRLVVSIQDNKETFANSYYHWSGYSSSAAEITDMVVNAYKKIKDKNKISKSIKMLARTGAGLMNSEMEEFLKIKFSQPDFKCLPISCIDRNSGLIAISKKEMGNSQNWSEGDVFINIENETVSFEVYSCVDPYWLVESFSDKFAEKLKIPEDISELSEDEIDDFAEKIKDELAGKLIEFETNVISFDDWDDWYCKFQKIDSFFFINEELCCLIE